MAGGCASATADDDIGGNGGGGMGYEVSTQASASRDPDRGQVAA